MSQALDTNGLRYVLLPGNPGPEFRHRPLYNSVYRFWRDVWSAVFTEAGNPAALVADDFMRQDYIPVILSGDQVVAAHFYTFFDLYNAVTRDHRYFSIFPPDVLSKLEDRRATYLMSMEFLTVNPEWRKAFVELSLAAVISSLGLRLMKTQGADAAIAPARKKTKVDQLAYLLGATCLKTDVSRGNLDCDLIAVFRDDVKPHTDPRVVSLVEDLWTARLDTTKEAQAEPRKLTIDPPLAA